MTGEHFFCIGIECVFGGSARPELFVVARSQPKSLQRYFLTRIRLVMFTLRELPCTLMDI